MKTRHRFSIVIALFSFAMMLNGCDVVRHLLQSIGINEPPRVELLGLSTLENGSEGSYNAETSDADGDALTIEWLVDGLVRPAFDDRSTFIFSATPADLSHYLIEVRVSDGKETASDTLQVTVQAPTISLSVQILGDESIAPSESPHFAASVVNASNPSSLSYQWFLDDIDTETASDQNYVDFNGLSLGQHIVRVTVRDGDEESSDSFTFTVEDPSTSQIVITYPDGTVTTSHDFGSVGVGDGEDCVFFIENTGDANLVLEGPPYVIVEGIDATCITVTTQPVSATIPPLEHGTFTIRFSPSSVGLKTVSLRIGSNDPDNSTETITLSGTGSLLPVMLVTEDATAPQTSIADGTGVFTLPIELRVGEFLNIPFTVRNIGLANLHITGYEFTNAAYSMSGAPVATVEPGGSTSFLVHFLPTDAGNISTWVILYSDWGTYEFVITFTVLNPEINVRLDSSDIADGIGTVSFGDVPAGSSAYADKIFTLENQGQTNLVLSSPYLVIGGTNASSFSIVNAPSYTIAAGASTAFTIRFTPSTGGGKEATLSITSNDKSENPYDFTLTGTGTTAPEIELRQSATVIPTGTGSVLFAELPCSADFYGIVDQKTFTILNLGNADLSLSASPKVYIEGADSDTFSVITYPTSPVTPGASTTFVLRYALNSYSFNDKTATIKIYNNDPNETPFIFAVHGGTTSCSKEWHLAPGARVFAPLSGGMYRACLPAGSVTYTPGAGFSWNSTADELAKFNDNGTWKVVRLNGAGQYEEPTLRYIPLGEAKHKYMPDTIFSPGNLSGWQLFDFDVVMNGTDAIYGNKGAGFETAPNVYPDSAMKVDGKWGFYTNWKSSLSPPLEEVFVPFDDPTYGKATWIDSVNTGTGVTMLWGFAANSAPTRYFFLRKQILSVAANELYCDTEAWITVYERFIRPVLQCDLQLFLRKPDGTRVLIYYTKRSGMVIAPIDRVGGHGGEWFNIPGTYWLEAYCSTDVWSPPTTNLVGGISVSGIILQTADVCYLTFVDPADLVTIPRYTIDSTHVWDNFGDGYNGTLTSPQRSNLDDDPWAFADNYMFVDYFIDPLSDRVNVDYPTNLPEVD